MKKRKKSDFKSVQDLLLDYDWDKKQYITKEFQDYGYRLAVECNDLKHKSLFIKLAKETDRRLLEQARAFVKDARNVKNKGKLFMWALTKLKKGEPLYEEKEDEDGDV